MRKVGLHIRFEGSLLHVIRKAADLQVPFFQCFLINEDGDRLLQLSEDDVQLFLQVREQFEAAYVHGSYWINLAGKTHGGGLRALQRELQLARQLNFSHIVLHPGHAKGFTSKKDGIGLLARTLNAVIRQETAITFVLENTAHGGLSIGGDLQDFTILRDYLEYPEKVLFCIDTAHAYSYGYDLVDARAREQFIADLDSTMGIRNIHLIHLNDTCEQLGSKIDKHHIIGQGTIGLQALKAFATHPLLKEIPVLLEPPLLSIEQEQEILGLVRSW